MEKPANAGGAIQLQRNNFAHLVSNIDLFKKGKFYQDPTEQKRGQHDDFIMGKLHDMIVLLQTNYNTYKKDLQAIKDT